MTIAVICAWVTVIYKDNLQVMLQYLIRTAQIEKLHHSKTEASDCSEQSEPYYPSPFHQELQLYNADKNYFTNTMILWQNYHLNEYR